MSIYEHSNGLASTIDFRCNKKKQDKCLTNHHFPLHLPRQTKHNSCEHHYTALIWSSINFQWVFGMELIRGGGEWINKALGGVESTLAGIWEKNLHKNWSTCRHGRTDSDIFGGWRGSSGENKRHTRTQQSIIWWMVCSNRQGNKKQLFFLTLYDSTNSTQAISSIFSPNIQLGPNYQQSSTKMAVARLMCDEDSSEEFYIIDTII